MEEERKNRVTWKDCYQRALIVLQLSDDCKASNKTRSNSSEIVGRIYANMYVSHRKRGKTYEKVKRKEKDLLPMRVQCAT